MKPNANAEQPRSLEDALMVAAVTRHAYQLWPYPQGVAVDKINSAVAALRAKGFVYGTARSPNLTPDGVKAAKALQR